MVEDGLKGDLVQTAMLGVAGIGGRLDSLRVVFLRLSRLGTIYTLKKLLRPQGAFVYVAYIY